MGEERDRRAAPLIRLQFVVEGETEEAFVREVLQPHLSSLDIYCSASSVGGGGKWYQKLKRDLELWMKSDSSPSARFTSMIDVYRLPADFPRGDSKAEAKKNPLENVRALEEAFARDIRNPRFMPYLQLHEFQAILLSDPAKFSVRFPNRPEKIEALRVECDRHPSPEHIDDGPQTAPSKRILKHFEDYDKRASGQ